MMTYETAQAIVAELAPDLILDPEVPDQAHICVRKTEAGMPFSIMLPVSDDADANREQLSDALSAAKKHLNA